MAAGVVVGTLILTYPAIILGLYLRAAVTRALSVLFHIPVGLAKFPTNWSTLVLTLDLRSPPELVPGLPNNSLFKIDNWKMRFPVKEAKIVYALLAIALPILYGPSYLFRITLKSTFFIYWPLLFVATVPRIYKDKDGSLIWDNARGRFMTDWAAVVIALCAIIVIVSPIYDPSNLATFTRWAEAKDLPHHALLQIVSFNIWELDLWEWFALLASGITVILFVWANVINTKIRHSSTDRQPKWITLKTIYFLKRAQMLFVAVTIATSVLALLWFIHDSCNLSEFASSWTTKLFGPPQSCSAIETLLNPV